MRQVLTSLGTSRSAVVRFEHEGSILRGKQIWRRTWATHLQSPPTLHSTPQHWQGHSSACCSTAVPLAPSVGTTERPVHTRMLQATQASPVRPIDPLIVIASSTSSRLGAALPAYVRAASKSKPREGRDHEIPLPHEQLSSCVDGERTPICIAAQWLLRRACSSRQKPPTIMTRSSACRLWRAP